MAAIQGYTLKGVGLAEVERTVEEEEEDEEEGEVEGGGAVRGSEGGVRHSTYLLSSVNPITQPLKLSATVELAPPTLSWPEGREAAPVRETETPSTVREILRGTRERRW